MLDLFNDQVVSVDYLRDQGFLNGMGIIDEVDTSGNGNEPATGSYSGGEYEVVCHEPTNGAVDGGRTAMETCLGRTPTSMSSTRSTNPLPRAPSMRSQRQAPLTA